MGKAGTRSINRKLARLVVVAIGSAMTVVALLATWQASTLYLDGKRDTLLATAGAFAAATGDALAARDQRAAYLALRGIAAVPGIQFADLRDEAGRSVAGIGSGVRLRGDLDLSERDRTATPLGLLATGTVSVSVPVRKEGRVIGSLALVGDVSDLPSRLLDALVPIAAGFAAALAIGLAISLRLQRSITRPLIALTRLMAAVEADHDYTRQVAIDSDDEVGLLAQSFKSMLHEVWGRDRQLVAHRDRLEQDVAERTHDLRLAKDDAEAANAAKSDFLATMSHEIRTPMNGMLVMAELLAGSDLPDRQRRYAEVIARSGQSLMEIIDDILDFSKIEAGKLTLERIPFSLPDVVDTVVTLFAEKANAKGIDLAAFVDARLPQTITGDPVRLTQVLGNLINNALKFTAAGHVLVAADLRDGSLRLSVTDTGIGIPADKVGKLFSAFAQADQSTTRRFGGTGLGLAISKRIVDAMEGSVTVESREGEGSCFSVSLPLTDAIPPRSAEPTRPRPVRIALAGEATAGAARRSLAEAGFAVVPAGSGARADEAADLVADADLLLGRGRPAGAGRVVGVAPIGDASGTEALRLGLADVLVRRPIVQAEWRDVLSRLSRDGALAPATVTTGLDAGPAAPSDVAGLHVLVVDDGAVNREVATEALARLGITSEAVDSGRAALAAVASGAFDLVLMDGSMPDMDGYEATRLLRARETEAGLAPLPVIALTAHVVGPAAELWRAAGMDDVLHKPFTVAGLADVIRRTLSGHSWVGPRRSAGLQREERQDGVGGPTPSCSGTTVDARPARQPRPAPSAAPREPDDLLDAETLAGLEDMAEAAGGGFLPRIVELFTQGAPRCLAELREAAAAHDPAAVAAASHKLKSMSMNVGAARVGACMAAIEAAALDEASIPPPFELDEAERDLQRTVAALRSRVDPARNRRAA